MAIQGHFPASRHVCRNYGPIGVTRRLFLPLLRWFHRELGLLDKSVCLHAYVCEFVHDILFARSVYTEN